MILTKIYILLYNIYIYIYIYIYFFCSCNDALILNDSLTGQA